MASVRASEVAPPPSVGAPLPLLLASDFELALCYETSPDGAEIVVLTFEDPIVHRFGSPNDEALAGHPLYAKGLRPYGVYEVVGSEWIDALEKANRVHPHHDARRFAGLQHLVFTFHDTTLECVSRGIRNEKRMQNRQGAARRALLEAIGTTIEGGSVTEILPNDLET